MITIPRVWELLGYFKEECHSRGWKTSENEDWVKVDNEFHSFLWARNVHPSTFKKIVTACKCAIKQGISYQVVSVAYTAWLFPEAPPAMLVHTVARDSKLARRIAIYDLSNVYAGKPVCFKLNETSSEVFQEFENFLKKKWGVELKPAFSLLKREI
ncbi:MAG: hypothetical protein ACE5KC_02740 [Candidatus Bathyarchaeia archaeon]